MATPKTYRIAKYTISYVREGSVSFPATAMKSRHDVAEAARQLLGDNPLEQVVFFALDNANRILGMMSEQGTVNQCPVLPQNVFRFLLSVGAASFIMVHNHPGGNTEFSAADIQIVRKLVAGGKALDIPLLDSLVIADQFTVCMRGSANWPD